MFKAILDFLNKIYQKEETNEAKENQSKNLAKQRLHVLLVQDRASVSADFIELMKEEVIEVAKKYVVFKEENVEIDITTSVSNDGQNTDTGLFLKIPIENIRNEMKSEALKRENEVKDLIFSEKKKDALNNKYSLDMDSEGTIIDEEVKNISLEIDITKSELEELKELQNIEKVVENKINNNEKENSNDAENEVKEKEMEELQKLENKLLIEKEKELEKEIKEAEKELKKTHELTKEANDLINENKNSVSTDEDFFNNDTKEKIEEVPENIVEKNKKDIKNNQFEVLRESFKEQYEKIFSEETEHEMLEKEVIDEEHENLNNSNSKKSTKKLKDIASKVEEELEKINILKDKKSKSKTKEVEENKTEEIGKLDIYSKEFEEEKKKEQKKKK